MIQENVKLMVTVNAVVVYSSASLLFNNEVEATTPDD